MIKKQILLIPFVVFIIILLSFFYLLIIERNPSELPSNLLNKTTPKFETNKIYDDSTFISSKEFGNEIVLVNFFATWYKPCKKEHKYIKLFSEKDKIRVIGINYKDKKNKTIQWLADLGNPYSDVLIDNTGEIGIDWGVYGIPETYVVNEKGIIKYKQIGQITKKSYKKIISIIEKINNEK